MKSNDNEIFILKNSLFTMICSLNKSISANVGKKVDSQSIFALTKLIDSFIKLSQIESVKNDDESDFELSEKDKIILEIYNNKLIQEMAPRAGLEPATERLTAACSTTELPRN